MLRQCFQQRLSSFLRAFFHHVQDPPVVQIIEDGNVTMSLADRLFVKPDVSQLFELPTCQTAGYTTGHHAIDLILRDPSQRGRPLHRAACIEQPDEVGLRSTAASCQPTPCCSMRMTSANLPQWDVM